MIVNQLWPDDEDKLGLGTLFFLNAIFKLIYFASSGPYTCTTSHHCHQVYTLDWSEPGSEFALSTVIVTMPRDHRGGTFNQSRVNSSKYQSKPHIRKPCKDDDDWRAKVGYNHVTRHSKPIKDELTSARNTIGTSVARKQEHDVLMQALGLLTVAQAINSQWSRYENRNYRLDS